MGNESRAGGQAVTVFAPDDLGTGEIGAALAKIVHRGDLVLLEGELGAGKSALARALVRALLAVPDLEVPSPSFLLAVPYHGQGWSVVHADLYRLSAPGEVDELGLDDDPDALVLVEWGERAPQLRDRADMLISLEIPADGKGRRINIRSLTGRHDLAPLRHGFSMVEQNER